MSRMIHLIVGGLFILILCFNLASEVKEKLQAQTQEKAQEVSAIVDKTDQEKAQEVTVIDGKTDQEEIVSAIDNKADQGNSEEESNRFFILDIQCIGTYRTLITYVDLETGMILIEDDVPYSSSGVSLVQYLNPLGEPYMYKTYEDLVELRKLANYEPYNDINWYEIVENKEKMIADK